MLWITSLDLIQGTPPSPMTPNQVSSSPWASVSNSVEGGEWKQHSRKPRD